MDRQSCSCYVIGDDIYIACHVYGTKSNICLLKSCVSARFHWMNLTNTWWGRSIPKNMCEEITVHLRWYLHPGKTGSSAVYCFLWLRQYPPILYMSVLVVLFNFIIYINLILALVKLYLFLFRSGNITIYYHLVLSPFFLCHYWHVLTRFDNLFIKSLFYNKF